MIIINEIKELKIKIYYFIFKIYKKIINLLIWGLGIGPNPQSPIPNPQSPMPNFLLYF